MWTSTVRIADDDSNGYCTWYAEVYASSRMSRDRTFYAMDATATGHEVSRGAQVYDYSDDWLCSTSTG